jgi:hypothetical protein
LGITSSQATFWKSATSLSAQLSTGLGGHLSLVLTAGESSPKSTWIGAYDYFNPEISELIPFNGPVTGGYPIKAYGFDFGFFDSTVYGRVGDQPCESTTWQSDSSFLCKIPYIAADAKALLDISVQRKTFRTYSETASEIAAAKNLFQYDAPKVTDLTRLNFFNSQEVDFFSY